MSDLLSRLEAETHRNGMWADTCELLMEARAKLAEYEAALNSIACFDDEGGSQRLTNTGSYSGFDEPGSVRIAREVVAKAAAIHNRSTT